MFLQQAQTLIENISQNMESENYINMTDGALISTLLVLLYLQVILYGFIC